MTRRATVDRATVTQIVIALLAVSLSVGSVVAQTKQQVSIKIPLQDLKFGVHQSIEVGDAPNHIVRVFELSLRRARQQRAADQRDQLKEVWQRGTADIADGVGTTSSYFSYHMENGDKFFVRERGYYSARSGGGRLPRSGLDTFSAARGNFKSIKGTTRNATTFDPKAGVADDAELDIEYAMGK